MSSLSHILRKYPRGYESQEKINYLMHMENFKLFAKSEKELETLIQPIKIYSQNIGREFDIKYVPKS